MKALDYFYMASIQSVLVAPIAYIVWPIFFETSLGITGGLMMFIVVFIGYLMAMPMIQRSPNIIRFTLIKFLIVGFSVGAIIFFMYFMTYRFLGLYTGFPVSIGASFIFSIALTGAVITWLTGKLT